MKEIKDFYQNSTSFEKRLIKFIGYISIFVSVVCFYYFVSNKIFFIGSDAYAYMSMADSARESGKLLDITTIPATPPKTPQNGIVLFHLIFSYLGMSQYQRLLSIVVINYIIYLSAVYPLFKISSGLGLKDNKLAVMSLIGTHLGAWHVYRFELLAINDGIFYSSTIWLNYLAFNLLNRYYNNDTNKQIKVQRSFLVGVLCVSFLSLLFRLNTIFILVSIISTVILFDAKKRNFRLTYWILALIIFVMGLFFILYRSIDISLIHSITVKRINELSGSLFNFKFLYGGIKLFVMDTLPRIVARPLFGKTNLLFCIFLFPPFISFIKGYQKNSVGEVFIGIQCIIMFIVGSLILNKARYIMHIYPLLYLMMFSIPRMRIVAHLFVCLVFANTMRTVSREWVRVQDSNLWLHVYENRIALPDDNKLLLTEQGRHSYFFFKTRAYGASFNNQKRLIEIPDELTWSLIEKKGSLFVHGDSKYIHSAFSQVEEMALSNGYELQSKSLTPALNEFEGWKLVELKLKKSNKH